MCLITIVAKASAANVAVSCSLAGSFVVHFAKVIMSAEWKNKVIFHFSSLNQGWGSPERPEIIKKQLGEKK